MSRFHPQNPAQLAKELEREVPEKCVVVDVTLTASAASTTFANAALRPTSSVHLTPMTSNAAGALSGLYIDTPSLGAVVINHANNAQSDKTFRATIING